MEVRWGGRGSTEEGSKLEFAKEAKITEPPTPEPAPETPSGVQTPHALQVLGSWLARVYGRVAVMRPQPGETGRCMNFKREKSLP
ncbi:anthrax toxin receptor 1-like [Lampetra fluviatilis]